MTSSLSAGWVEAAGTMRPMANENRLDDALLVVLERLILERPEAEIPDAGGLRLKMSLERMKSWPVLQSPLELTWLRLEDSQGNELAAYRTSQGELASRLRGGTLRYTLQILLARLIMGVQGQKPMTELVEEWAAKAPGVGPADADAEAARGWLRRVAQAEVSGPEV
jgi:hypothetical protein